MTFVRVVRLLKLSKEEYTIAERLEAAYPILLDSRLYLLLAGDNGLAAGNRGVDRIRETTVPTVDISKIYQSSNLIPYI